MAKTTFICLFGSTRVCQVGGFCLSKKSCLCFLFFINHSSFLLNLLFTSVGGVECEEWECVAVGLDTAVVQMTGYAIFEVTCIRPFAHTLNYIHTLETLSEPGTKTNLISQFLISVIFLYALGLFLVYCLIK